MRQEFINKEEFENRFVRIVERRICELSKCRDEGEIKRISLRITALLELAEEMNILELDHIAFLDAEAAEAQGAIYVH